MGTVNSNAATSAATTGSKSSQDKENFIGTREDFLTLLLAQLKHQDPLSPMKGTEFIDSITRLSAVEQTINQNAHLENIEALLTNQQSNFGSPVSYLDKTVEFETPVVHMASGKSDFYYNLLTRPENVVVTIRNASGNVVRKMDGGTQVGRNTINWDGKDNAGNRLADGDYKVTVDYIDANGENITLPTVSHGVVTGADFSGGEVFLTVGNIQTTMDKILSIRSNTVIASN